MGGGEVDVEGEEGGEDATGDCAEEGEVREYEGGVKGDRREEKGKQT